jgi:hypothetical protein
MKNDYLWDAKGDADPDTEALEQVLGALKFEEKPLQIRRRRVYTKATWILTVAASIVLTSDAALWWWQSESGIVPDEADRIAQLPSAVPQETVQPPSPSPPQEPAPQEDRTLASSKSTPTTPSRIQMILELDKEPEEFIQTFPDEALLAAHETRSLDAENTPLFTAGDDLLNGEITDHLEHAQQLLRSFKNVPVLDYESEWGLDYEKARARYLLTDNMLLRRDTRATGDTETSNLLNKLEVYLLDIANIGSDQAEVEFVKGRIEQREIIAALQIRRE